MVQAFWRPVQPAPIMGAMPRAPRLDPPPVALRPEHEYVLARAFGPVERSAGRPEPQPALALARALDLEGRLAARNGLQQLADELGRDAALELLARRALLAAQARTRASLLREMERLAGAAGVPCAPLKGAALERRGVVPEGGRRAGDLDLLVPQADAPRLARALRERGLELAGHPGHAHQLPPLRTREGHVLELHVEVPGLGPPGGRWRELQAGGLLEADPEAGPLPHRPTPRLLAAHAIVHGLWQHALAPESYPPARVLADLADLRAAGLLPDADTLAPLVAPRVPRTRLEALLRLVALLCAGERVDPAPAPAESPGWLLDHVLAASLDAGYRARLRRRERLDSLRSPAHLPSVVWRALVPGEALLELRYGPARGALGRVARRVRHPFHVLARAAALLRPAATHEGQA